VYNSYRVERVEDAVINTRAASQVAHMVGNDINHQVHATCMKGSRESLEISGCSEVAVERVDILGPVPMVRLAICTATCQVLYNGGDPYLDAISRNN
jgi:hypothetical protein